MLLFSEVLQSLESEGKVVPLPITVTARSKARTVLGPSNAEIVGSNPTQGMDVCIVCVYPVFRLFLV
jgi:hypothetical protein